MFGIGKKLGATLIGGSLLFSSSVANAAATEAGQWATLSALGTSSSAAAVAAAQENPQPADPYFNNSGHGLGASTVLLGLGILLVIAIIALAHDSDDEEDSPLSPS